MSTINSPPHYRHMHKERLTGLWLRGCCLSRLPRLLLVWLRLLLLLRLWLRCCCLSLLWILSWLFHPRIDFAFIAERGWIRTPNSGQVVRVALGSCVRCTESSSRRWNAAVLHCARRMREEVPVWWRHVRLAIGYIVGIICVPGEVILEHRLMVVKRSFVHVSAEIYFIPLSMCHIMITQIISSIDLLSRHVTRFQPITELNQTSFRSWKEEKRIFLLNYDYRGIEIEDYVMKK